VDDLHEIIDSKFRDVKTEALLLAYLLKKDPNLTLTKDAFSTAPHRMLFSLSQAHHDVVAREVVLDHIERRIPVAKLEAYKAAVLRVYETKTGTLTVKASRVLAKKLQRLGDTRTVLLAADRVASLAIEGKLDEAKKVARDAASVGSAPSSKYAGEYLEDFEERLSVIEARNESPDTVGVPTGVSKFDAATGGMMRGEFGIVLGQTGIGKSMMLENFALNAWQADFNIAHKAHNILYISLEMGKHDLEFRADSRLARIAHKKFRTGKNWTDKDFIRWKARAEDLKRNASTYFHIECLPRHCAMPDVEATAERVQAHYGKPLDLVVLDYLNLLGSEVKHAEKRERDWTSQADVAWQVKAFAADFNEGQGVAVWTANQVRDAAEGKEVLTWSDVKYARAIAEVAPVVVGLVQGQDDILREQMQMQLVKVRGSKQLPPIVLSPNFDFCTVDDEERTMNSLEAL